MRKVLLINVVLFFTFINAFTQNNNVDTSKASSKYYRFDGDRLIDIRNATKYQLSKIYERERINNLSENRFFGFHAKTRDGRFPRQSLALRFQQNTSAKIYEGNRWRWGTLYKKTVIISGNSNIEIIDGLITPENAKDYRFRIIKNDNKELIGWTIPSNFKKTEDGLYTYCFLGNLTYEAGQFLQIEIYNVKNYRDRDAIIVDWRETRKLAFWSFVDYRKKSFRNTLLSFSLGNDNKSGNVNFIATDTLKDVKFRLGDSLVRLGFISHNERTPYNYQIYFKSIIKGKTERKDLGNSDGSFFLYKEFWDKPGKYEITFTPKLSTFGGNVTTYVKGQSITYKFTVLPELNPKNTYSQRQMAIFGMILAFCFIPLLVGTIILLKRASAKKLVKQFQQKELFRLQLGSVRSQLNPHFMFNALAGIQNLMNKNKIEEANSYLVKFARLTRNVLDQKELISLAEEKALLEDYLQMEQLRFGFNYSIVIDQTLDLNNVEIPAMLLQPFVENAVKHGIAEKESLGKIKISFTKNEQDLVLKIKDNGQGFDSSKNYDGLGLQLSKNRITLLNNIYTTTPFLLAINSNKSETIISITLAQWL